MCSLPHKSKGGVRRYPHAHPTLYPCPVQLSSRSSRPWQRRLSLRVGSAHQAGRGGGAEDATQRLACPATTPCVAARCPAARCNLMQSHATPWRISAGHSPRAQPTSTAYEHSPRGGPGPQPQPPPRSRRATPPRSTPTTYTYHLHTYHLHTYHLQVHVRVVRVCVGASVAPSRPS